MQISDKKKEILNTILLLLVQVSALVAQIFQMRVKMKNLMGVMEGGSIPALSGLEDALKAEQKVSSISSSSSSSSLTCTRV